ncbi:Gfo/Idh/MocA family oxidoreductase [Candidatus Sumerlaeota bacterium]|nr:Gfo/Idh/MocA family oxidoreductase [Candidatus Sumerlaeota bacterium]
MKTVRLGIIGVGSMGHFHARSVLEGKIARCTLSAICDIDPERLAKFNDAKDVKQFNKSGELIRSGEVDAVLIATPHYGHTTIGIDALQQGLHVLVEKPISVHKADCEKLIAAYKKSKKRKQLFAAMFNQRTDPKYQKIKKMIEDGELGQFTRVNWIITDWFRTESYYASGGWRATWAGEGGGVLLNQCPHQLDLIWWLCGSPCEVHGFCDMGKRHNIEVEDEVTAYLKYPNGATGVFITSTGEAPGTNRLEICGDKGKILVEGDRVMFYRNEQPMFEFSKTDPRAFSKPPVWEIKLPASGSGEQHHGILRNFTAAILDGAPLIAQATDGIHSVELGNAMLLSSLTGKGVKLPMDGKAYERQLKKLIAGSTFKKASLKKKAEGDDMSSSF